MDHQSAHFSDIPMGFGLALVHNPEAMERFSSMSDEERRMVLEGMHGIDPSVEMRRYVNSLVWK